MASSEGRPISIVPLTEWGKLSYVESSVQNGISPRRTVSGAETAPGGDGQAKFLARKDRALATIVLAVEPSLLYILGDPEDPGSMAETSESIPKEDVGEQDGTLTQTTFATAEEQRIGPGSYQGHDRTVQ